MPHYLLLYDVADDYFARRGEFRAAHPEKARQSVVEAFARVDPYVVDGLVTRWRVREWTAVAGADATTPVRP